MRSVPPDVEPVDPLVALRSADARPFHERWRAERNPLPMLVGAAALVLVLVGWRIQQAQEPPIEDSLPRAAPAEEVAPPREQPKEPGESTASAVVVHVAGAVRQPGLVVGDDGWRVADAIAAAGGSEPGADLDRVNLAARVLDGERIYVPEVGETALPEVVAGSRATGSGEGSGPVNLNTADAGLLESLPGVGPATAATIIAHRDEHGPFGSVDALVAVRGIGPATLEALREHVTVG